ncbi:MAG: O-antigen ligase family protein [Flavipsychrobacter sp.]|nr:O-antigen ligase family protein [Flavipsychrobacter sp.]
MFQPMEVRGKVPTGTLHRIIYSMFLCALFALPWLNQAHVSTILFILTGVALLFTGIFRIDYSFYGKQLTVIAFGIYFVLQLVACYGYPVFDNIHEIEEKAALLGIPLLLYMLTLTYEDIWHRGLNSFVLGCIAASLWCMTIAIVQYSHTHDAGVFFYHSYSSAVGLNAIYFSLYLLTSIGYVVLNQTSFNPYFVKGIGIFLYINLLLLSSKIAIAIGSLLLLILLFKAIKNNWQKVTLLIVAAGVYLILTTTVNPIRKRFADVTIASYSSALTATNFKDYPFDGLSLRLVLWRLGYELMNEKGLWLKGDGGAHYKEDLNAKMMNYQLYTGNSKNGDTGYLNYNMHNQYMESYMQYGIAGGILILTVLGYALYLAVRYSNAMLVYAVVLFMVFFLTESVLETQSGILLFTIIISGEWIQLQRKRPGIVI